MLFPLEATTGAIIYSKLQLLTAGGNERRLDFAFIQRRKRAAARSDFLFSVSAFASLHASACTTR